MQFLVTKTSDGSRTEPQAIAFDTLGAFISWVREQNNPVIIDVRSDPPELEIYDDYRE